MAIPKDPVMLLSYLNTQLRDYYSSLEECCHGIDAKKEDIEAAMAAIDYHYDEAQNRFL